MKKNSFLIVVFLLFALGLSSTKENELMQHGTTNKVSFGVKIGLLPTGGLTQYALIYYKENQLISIQEVSLDYVVKIGTGEWPIPRTAIFHDYFEEYGVHGDTLEDGTVIDYASAFDSLWKVRFNAHPYDHKKGKGWSQGEIRPSLKQQQYIYDRYGVRGYDQDYFSDSSFFKLLKDVMDPTWIANYKSLR